MLSSRLRSTPKPFDWLLIYDISDSAKGPNVSYHFPQTDSLPPIETRLRQFLFPCEHRSTLPEEYTLVFTNGDGSLEFVHCMFMPMTAYVICLHSSQSCFEYLHCVLTVITQKHMHCENKHSELTIFLEWLLSQDLQSPDAHQLFSLSYRSGLEYPFVLRFLLEYYGALSSGNWVTVFENLLLERSLIFHSSRIQRVTSCVLASLSLLYPFVWAHLIYPLLPENCIDYLGCPTPFVAGIHSCMVQKIKPMLSPGVMLVDLDDDTVYASDNVDYRLPNVIRRWLLRRCASAHKAVLSNRDAMRENWGAITSYLCQPYLETMALLLGGYRGAVYQLQQTSPRSPSTMSSRRLPSHVSPGTWVIDKEAFMHSRGSGCVDYLQKLLRSQMTVQFIESRLDYLNDETGMVPDDAFEDCVTRETNILVPDTLERIHLKAKTLNQLSKKLAILTLKKFGRPPALTKRKKSDASESGKSTGSVSSPPKHPTQPRSDAQEESSGSSSSESLDKLNSEELARTYEAERSSLVEAVFMSVPDIPPDWLTTYWRPKGDAVEQPTSGSEPIRPTPVVPSSESEKQSQLPPGDLLASFDPYRPVRSVPNGSTPRARNLPSIIQKFDPLNSLNNEEDLLK